MRESDIIHESGGYWVGRENNGYVVYKTGLTHSTADSTYPLTDDGKSIAIARCDYLAKRESKMTPDERAKLAASGIGRWRADHGRKSP